jgi:hypothetical protein
VRGARRHPNDRAWPFWDLLSKKKYEDVIKREVKTDFKWKETGNVALEHVALRHSTADVVDYKLYGLPGFREMSLVRALWLLDKYPVKPGGNQSHPLTLIPVERFIEVTTQL